MQYKNIHRIEKFKDIQEPREEKHTFSRTIQDQIKFRNIQEHSRISGHLDYFSITASSNKASFQHFER